MEAFVARHVLIKLLFNGDIDGYTTDPDTGEVVKAPRILFFFKRRHFWTLVIYLATLVPALLVDDLGPVLSFTGAIGGCSLAYIAPGLAYVGVHGEAVLAWLAEVVEGKNRTSKNAPGDLPVAGDPGANMQLAVARTTLDGAKPWWWIPLLMPIWVKIARKGASGMNERMTELGQSHGLLSPGTEQISIEVVPFRKRDLFFSIFFIVFGIIALVAGILSNIYVQVHGIFLSQ
jgi:sodium-coupled neutral amino acid transporter 11